MENLRAGGGFSDISKEEATELCYESNAAVQGELGLGSRCKYVGLLTKEFAKELAPRAFRSKGQSLQKKGKFDGPSDSTVLDVWLLDNTRRVAVTCWGDAATDLLNKLQELPIEGGADRCYVTPSVVRVCELQKNDWNGKSITPIKILHTVQSSGRNARTEITLSGRPSSYFSMNGAYCAPSYPVAIVNFLSVSSKIVAPFRGTFCGIV